jgi:hypothetical protein
MSRLPVALLACFVGCEVPAPEGMVSSQLPLPWNLDLQALDPWMAGQTVELRISDANPHSPIYLVRSDGQIGAGLCPPQLRGECLDITPGTTGYLVASLRTNAQGVATLRAPIPANLPDGARLVFQAVDVARLYGSNPLEAVVVGPGVP